MYNVVHVFCDYNLAIFYFLLFYSFGLYKIKTLLMTMTFPLPNHVPGTEGNKKYCHQSEKSPTGLIISSPTTGKMQCSIYNALRCHTTYESTSYEFNVVVCICLYVAVAVQNT